MTIFKDDKLRDKEKRRKKQELKKKFKNKEDKLTEEDKDELLMALLGEHDYLD